MGDRAFERTWNSLRPTIRKTKTLSSLKQTVETVLYWALDIAMTVNILVKHHLRGLRATVLYKSSYLHYITILGRGVHQLSQ